MVPTKSVSLFEFVSLTDFEVLCPDCIMYKYVWKNELVIIVSTATWFFVAQF